MTRTELLKQLEDTIQGTPDSSSWLVPMRLLRAAYEQIERDGKMELSRATEIIEQHYDIETGMLGHIIAYGLNDE